MKPHAALYLAIFALLSLQSCGVMPLSADQGQRVQTKFFGASFGDKDENSVKEKMSRNGIGFGWLSVDKGTWGIENVSFAGKEWPITHVRFTDHRFSSISFSDTFVKKEDAVKRLDEMRDLLEKKYKMHRMAGTNKERQVYYYKDSLGTIVYIAAAKINVNGADLWISSINYSWYMVPQIVEEKALNEI